MIEPIDTGALLSRSFELPAGPRVRLRLARRTDAQQISALLLARDVEATVFSIERLVRCDPSQRVAICATAPLSGTETVVGVGAIDLREGAEPDTVVVDERLTQGLGELLERALLGRARAHLKRVA